MERLVKHIAYLIARLRLYPYLAWLLALCPATRLFDRLRGRMLAPFPLRSGRNLTVGYGFYIPRPELVAVGHHVGLNNNVFVNPSKGAPVSIGDYSVIGPFVVLRSGDHRFDRSDVPIRYQGHSKGPITIEEDCWIASSVTVVKGVTIGKGSVIGANSVVTRDIPPGSIAVGVPARVIRKREQSEAGEVTGDAAVVDLEISEQSACR